MYALTIIWLVSVLGGSSDIIRNLTNKQITQAHIIQQHALENKINPDKFLLLAVCESGLNQQAVGDKGKAKGIYQFHLGTWNRYAELYNAPINRDNATDQIYLAARIIGEKKEGIYNWYNCGKKLNMI